MMLTITGESLQIEDVLAVANGMRVALDRSALPSCFPRHSVVFCASSRH